jgi:hypothetical protein
MTGCREVRRRREAGAAGSFPRFPSSDVTPKSLPRKFAEELAMWRCLRMFAVVGKGRLKRGKRETRSCLGVSRLPFLPAAEYPCEGGSLRYSLGSYLPVSPRGQGDAQRGQEVGGPAPSFKPATRSHSRPEPIPPATQLFSRCFGSKCVMAESDKRVARRRRRRLLRSVPLAEDPSVEAEAASGGGLRRRGEES